MFKSLVTADLRQKISRVLQEAQKLGYEIDPEKVTAESKGYLRFRCPTVHTESGKHIMSYLEVELATGEITLDQPRMCGSTRAIRISLKKKLTVKNNCLKWMLEKNGGHS